MNFPLCLERIECGPGAGEAGSEVAERRRMIQRIECEIGLVELTLPQPSTEGIDRIVAAGDVFGEIEVG